MSKECNGCVLYFPIGLYRKDLGFVFYTDILTCPPLLPQALPEGALSMNDTFLAAAPQLPLGADHARVEGLKVQIDGS